MILKTINRTIPKNIRINLLILYILIIIAAFLELVSLGLIPLFVSYLISENASSFYNHLNIENFLKFLPGDNHTLQIASLILLVFSFKFVYMIFVSFYELTTIRKIKLYFSTNIYSAYVDKKYNFFLKKNSSELGRNIINEIENAVQFIICILNLSREISLIIVIGILLVIFDPIISLIGIFFISFFVLIFYLITDRKLKSIAKHRVKLFGDIFKHVIETFSIIKEIKIYSKQKFFIKKFVNTRTNLESFLIKRDFLVRLPKIIFEFLAVFLIISIIVLFTVFSKNNSELFTLLSLLALAVVRLLPSFNQISISLTHFASYKISFEILAEEINTFLKNNKKNKQNLILQKDISPTDNEKLDIIIDKVSFNYDENGNSGLKNISLQIKTGEMIGFIGRSGAGKSTLVNLILKLLEPKSGKVNFINNKRSCGYVPQDIFLLDDTLKANIALAQENSEIDEEKLIDIIEKCELTNFVNQHNQGTDLILGERGIRISGGEKQRIGLARTLYSNKKIIVLDEATSSLDSQTEKSIMKSILKFKRDLTIIIVAHRLSTLEHCDRVILLENGEIKDQGKLDFLISKYPNLNLSFEKKNN
jgi:ABC-type multidrug transport system fused ATPase/permease subunit